MTPVGCFTVGADHPSLPGHFPGQPVVPGVVLLDHALVLLGGGVRGLPVVKFLRPVRPGQTVAVARQARQDGSVAFACSVDGAEVVRGVLARDMLACNGAP